MQPEYLTPTEAVDYLIRHYNVHYSPRTFAKVRSTSTDGPVFVSIGRRVYYRPDDLDRWIMNRAKTYRTTAERTVAEARAKAAPKAPVGNSSASQARTKCSSSRDLDIFKLLAGQPG